MNAIDERQPAQAAPDAGRDLASDVTPDTGTTNDITGAVTSSTGAPEAIDSGVPADPVSQATAAQPAAAPRLNGDILATSLLAFLRISSAYGYHLVQQLAEANLAAFDSGTVYRTLRQLEKGGLVSSFWDTSESGPARRMYQLTAPGQIFLSTWIDALERHQALLRRAIDAVHNEQTSGGARAERPSGPSTDR